MICDSSFTAEELDDRVNAFVWAHDLTPTACQLIYSPEARALYRDAEHGIRIKHIIFASKLVELRIADIESRPHVESDIKYVKEDLTDLKNYLTRKLGHVPIMEFVESALVHPRDIELISVVPLANQVA